MYRIFCESYENFIKTIDKDSYRLQISKPFELILMKKNLKNKPN